jgi:hypothetical protein
VRPYRAPFEVDATTLSDENDPLIVGHPSQLPSAAYWTELAPPSPGTAHKFAGEDGFRRNQFLPRRNRFRRPAKAAGNGRRRSIGSLVKQRGSIMLAFLNLLYRAYCRARLLEMRRQHLAGY